MNSADLKKSQNAQASHEAIIEGLELLDNKEEVAELSAEDNLGASILIAALHIGNCLAAQTEAIREQTEVLVAIRLNTEVRRP